MNFGKITDMENNNINLRFDLREAYESNVLNHPQTVMKELGIEYEQSIPESIADCWIFKNCKNVPNPLPEYLVDISHLQKINNEKTN